MSTRLPTSRAIWDSSPWIVVDAGARPGEGDLDVAPLGAVPARQQPLDQLAEIDRVEMGARQFGVEPRGVGDLDDQPVEPADVVADDIEQTATHRRVLDPFERVDGRAERRQGVLHFVSHVGRERLGRVDPPAQALRHVAERARQQPDLVAPLGQERHVDLAVAAEPYPVRGVGQRAQGQSDGLGEEARQQDRDDQCGAR